LSHGKEVAQGTIAPGRHGSEPQASKKFFANRDLAAYVVRSYVVSKPFGLASLIFLRGSPDVQVAGSSTGRRRYVRFPVGREDRIIVLSGISSYRLKTKAENDGFSGSRSRTRFFGFSFHPPCAKVCQMSTPAADIRKWVRQRSLAEAREKAEIRVNAPGPAQALARGLGLAAFAEAVAETTGPRKTARPLAGIPAEDLLAYRRWARVRAALRVP
jgi:hypothetical protein